MKSKKKLFLLVLLAAVAALTLVAGCKIGEETLDDVRSKYKLTSQVTYFANGGTFDNVDTKKVKDIYYGADYYVINIKSKDAELGDGDTDSVTIGWSGYIINGWYYAKLDSNGQPVYSDEENMIVEPDYEKGHVTFPLRIPGSQHWYLCADWVTDVRLKYVLVSDSPVTISLSEDKTKVVNNGDVLQEENFPSGGITITTKPTMPASTTHTFLQIFSDEACTVPFVGTVEKPEGEDVQDYTLYAKYIAGSWAIVRDSSDVNTMFTSGVALSTRQYYFYPMSTNGHTDVIDCSSLSLSLKVNGTFKCKIEGNGCTLSNLTFKYGSLSNSAVSSLLGKIGASASIKNLTLSNVSVEYDSIISNATVNVYLVCSDVESGATLENFKVSGAKLNVKSFDDTSIIPAIDNIQLIGGQYETDNWLFGAYQTDAQFLAQYTGVTVEGAALELNGQIIVSPDGENGVQ